MKRSKFTDEQILKIVREAGKPIENAYVESFNGKFRDALKH